MTTKDEKEVVACEEAFWQAMSVRDGDAIARLTADPSILTGAQGVSSLPRDALVSMIEDPNATWELHDFELSDVKVQMLGEDIALVAYKVREEMTVEGEPTSLEAADTSTWVRSNGGWECVMHTEALLGDPFGRDRVKSAQKRR